ncbi:MAG: hypothetical protein GY847_04165 [Proteobacteria bacterium]|nr:hypothetical protein [Pseudomonadota bacterium]
MKINIPEQIKINAVWMFLLMLGLAYAVYVPSFGAVWLMDDLTVIVNNPDVRSLAAFWENYRPGRPLRELTYLIDYQFFGLEPFGYHFQQVLWHGLNAFLVYLLAMRFRLPWVVSVFASLIFLTHPVQVEVLANISHRKDSLSLAFCLLSFHAYLTARNGQGKTSWATFLISRLTVTGTRRWQVSVYW